MINEFTQFFFLSFFRLSCALPIPSIRFGRLAIISFIYLFLSLSLSFLSAEKSKTGQRTRIQISGNVHMKRKYCALHQNVSVYVSPHTYIIFLFSLFPFFALSRVCLANYA